MDACDNQGADFGLAQCTFPHREELAILTEMSQLEDDIRSPEAGRPYAQRAQVERYVLGARLGPYEGDKRRQGWQRKLIWGDRVGKQVVKVLEGVVSEHGPSLEAFNGAERACGWRAAFQGYHPLKDWEKA